MPKLIKHVRKDEQVVAKFATTVNNNRKVYHHIIFKGTKLANQFIAYICSRNNLNNLYHERREQRQTCVEY